MMDLREASDEFEEAREGGILNFAAVVDSRLESKHDALSSILMSFWILLEAIIKLPYHGSFSSASLRAVL